MKKGWGKLGVNEMEPLCPPVLERGSVAQMSAHPGGSGLGAALAREARPLGQTSAMDPVQPGTHSTPAWGTLAGPTARSCHGEAMEPPLHSHEADHGGHQTRGCPQTTPPEESAIPAHLLTPGAARPAPSLTQHPSHPLPIPISR